MNFTPLPRSFYEPTADVVAPKLLGHYLIRNTPQGPCGGIIVETEAYLSDDPACHAYGRKTQRNRTMWEKPGHAYVYLIYGYHYCFNVVCQPDGVAEAVLVRAIEPTVGIELMQENRTVTRAKDLTNGPAKQCAAMSITRELDGVDLCDATSPLYIADNPQVEQYQTEHGPLITTTRIGITQAADALLRYYLDGSAYISKRAPQTDTTAIT